MPATFSVTVTFYVQSRATLLLTCVCALLHDLRISLTTATQSCSGPNRHQPHNYRNIKCLITSSTRGLLTALYRCTNLEGRGLFGNRHAHCRLNGMQLWLNFLETVYS